MTKGDKELAIVFGGAGALLLIYLFWPKGQSVVNPPAPATIPLTQGISSTSGAVLVHLQPNVQTISQALEVNTAVIVYLPQGAQWQSMDGAGIADRTSPQAFVFQGPISHTFVWNDAQGTQSSTLILSVAPTVPTTSA